MERKFMCAGPVKHTLSKDLHLRHWLGLYRRREKSGDDRVWFGFEATTTSPSASNTASSVAAAGTTGTTAGSGGGSSMSSNTVACMDARSRLQDPKSSSESLPWARTRYEPDNREDGTIDIEKLSYPRARNCHDCSYAMQKQEDAEILWYDTD
ncbi:unnamed protein product [Amoebophrya sp. A25]|nr:unnamed protein product [Amoebophrya sp. A25]|eukprot:GSA25T00006138001.1